MGESKVAKRGLKRSTRCWLGDEKVRKSAKEARSKPEKSDGQIAVTEFKQIVDGRLKQT